MENKLRLKRMQHKHSQTDMARKLNIAISTYNMYENENRRIPLKVAKEISNILKCEVDDLFCPATFTIRK